MQTPAAKSLPTASGEFKQRSPDGAQRNQSYVLQSS